MKFHKGPDGRKYRSRKAMIAAMQKLQRRSMRPVEVEYPETQGKVSVDDTRLCQTGASVRRVNSIGSVKRTVRAKGFNGTPVDTFKGMEHTVKAPDSFEGYLPSNLRNLHNAPKWLCGTEKQWITYTVLRDRGWTPTVDLSEFGE